MELNLCLYCEKRLADDNMAFCSISCQSKEASKSFVPSYTTPFNSKLMNNNTMHYHHSTIRQSPGNKSYQMSYHRRPSLSYSSSTNTHGIDMISKRKKDSIERLSTSLSTTNRPPPFFLMQSLSTSSSSFSSSMSDASVFSTSCSCEDKAGNVCPPYHITRTTHNIAS